MNIKPSASIRQNYNVYQSTKVDTKNIIFKI